MIIMLLLLLLLLFAAAVAFAARFSRPRCCLRYG